MPQFKAILLLCFLTVASSGKVNLLARGNFVKLKIIAEEVSREILLKSVDRQIVYGNYANPDQFPYYGYAIVHRPWTSIFCGSSLISTIWLTTVAHCMRNATGAQIYFGSIDTQNMPTSRSAAGFIAHESFDFPTPYANDIALIKLSSAVSLSPSIQPITLPAFSQKAKDFTGAFMTVCGFGKTSSEYPRYLQYTTLSGISNAECNRAHWNFVNTMLCGKGAGNTGSGVCFGDSGLFFLDLSSYIVGFILLNNRWTSSY